MQVCSLQLVKHTVRALPNSGSPWLLPCVLIWVIPSPLCFTLHKKGQHTLSALLREDATLLGAEFCSPFHFLLQIPTGCSHPWTICGGQYKKIITVFPNKQQPPGYPPLWEGYQPVFPAPEVGVQLHKRYFMRGNSGAGDLTHTGTLGP